MKPVCTECGRISVPVETVHGLNGKDTIKLKCGHIVFDYPLPEVKDWASFQSIHGKRPYPFQAKSCEFAVQANLRCIFTHRMRLGKTIITTMLLNKFDEQLGKTLIICKVSLTVQWLMEVFEWSRLMAQRIETSKEPLHLDNFDVFIVSQDLLRDVPWRDKVVFRTIILDEVQNFKNTDAKRTKAVMQIAAKADFVIGLSGTPVKNHMAEYYPILHMVRPDLFPTEAGFIAKYVEHYYNGYAFQYGGIRNKKEFDEKTASFILGYTREEVMPELPRVRRTFRFLDLDSRTNDAYKKTLARWKDAYFKQGETAEERFAIKGEQRQELMVMYQIIGLAKVKPTIEYVEEVLDTSNGDAEKLVLFIEHIQVGNMLEDGLNVLMRNRGLDPVQRIRGGVDAEDAEAIAKTVRNSPNCRILLASTRACNEGKDFSFCNQAVMVERQWNATNEEQAEARLIHPTRISEFVDVNYMVARKTMDEAHAQLVEKKREISHQAVGEDVVKWSESDFMTELAAILSKEI